jgi:hypothetical protein
MYRITTFVVGPFGLGFDIVTEGNILDPCYDIGSKFAKKYEGEVEREREREKPVISLSVLCRVKISFVSSERLMEDYRF